jgi:hypothetical protein
MEDTNLLHRGGAVGLRYAQEAAAELSRTGWGRAQQTGASEPPRCIERSSSVAQPGRLRRLVGDHTFPRRFGSPFMSATAVLCSGQGYQNACMFDLLADAPEAAPVFEAAKFVLDGNDPRQLVREASNDELHADKVGQILCAAHRLSRLGS